MADANSLFTDPQLEFIVAFAKAANIDVNVAAAWVLSIQGGAGTKPVAYYMDGSFYNGLTYNNWLNFGITKASDLTDHKNGTHDALWVNPITAAQHSAAWLAGSLNAIPGWKPTGQYNFHANGNVQAQLGAIGGSGFVPGGQAGLAALYLAVTVAGGINTAAVENTFQTRTINVMATTYKPADAGPRGNGITATGVNVKAWRQEQRFYIVAVDPRVIPLGSTLTVSDSPWHTPTLAFQALDAIAATIGYKIAFLEAYVPYVYTPWTDKEISATVHPPSRLTQPLTQNISPHGLAVQQNQTNILEPSGGQASTADFSPGLRNTGKQASIAGNRAQKGAAAILRNAAFVQRYKV